MKTRIGVVTAVAFLGLATVALAAMKTFQVKPGEFEPEKTPLVNAAWIDGIGCPTNAKTAAAPPPDFEIEPGAPYTDPACPAGDPKDKKVEGLLMAKTGPTANVAAALAEIKHAPETVTELGWDIRKQGTSLSPLGSHCGAGAPRFNVTTSTGTFFVGCNSPLPTTQTVGMGWTRLTYAVSFTDVERIVIVFDEGQDTGPDFFGLAVLDNININGMYVGQGPMDAK